MHLLNFLNYKDNVPVYDIIKGSWSEIYNCEINQNIVIKNKIVFQ